MNETPQNGGPTAAELAYLNREIGSFNCPVCNHYNMMHGRQVGKGFFCEGCETRFVLFGPPHAKHPKLYRFNNFDEAALRSGMKRELIENIPKYPPIASNKWRPPRHPLMGL